jgi:hypothetical protein
MFRSNPCARASLVFPPPSQLGRTVASRSAPDAKPRAVTDQEVERLLLGAEASRLDSTTAMQE